MGTKTSRDLEWYVLEDPPVLEHRHRVLREATNDDREGCRWSIPAFLDDYQETRSDLTNTQSIAPKICNKSLLYTDNSILNSCSARSSWWCSATGRLVFSLVPLGGKTKICWISVCNVSCRWNDGTKTWDNKVWYVLANVLGSCTVEVAGGCAVATNRETTWCTSPVQILDPNSAPRNSACNRFDTPKIRDKLIQYRNNTVLTFCCTECGQWQDRINPAMPNFWCISGRFKIQIECLVATLPSVPTHPKLRSDRSNSFTTLSCVVGAQISPCEEVEGMNWLPLSWSDFLSILVLTWALISRLKLLQSQ